MWHRDSKASCRVTRTETIRGRHAYDADYYAFFVPLRVAELGRSSWDLVKYQIEYVLPKLGAFLQEANVPEAVIFGGEVSPDLSRQGRAALVDVLALLSFSPGGVDGLGYHFESLYEEAAHDVAPGPEN